VMILPRCFRLLCMLFDCFCACSFAASWLTHPVSIIMISRVVSVCLLMGC